MKKENINIPRTCECGTLMQEGEFLVGAMCGTYMRVTDGYNFPKTYHAIPYFCKNCGKINFFAEGVGKETKE